MRTILTAPDTGFLFSIFDIQLSYDNIALPSPETGTAKFGTRHRFVTTPPSHRTDGPDEKDKGVKNIPKLTTGSKEVRTRQGKLTKLISLC